MQRTPVTALRHFAVLLAVAVLVTLAAMASHGAGHGPTAPTRIAADDKVPTGGITDPATS
ncbi:hypothetical protein [Streptomyces sp. NPDC003717]|uniref:hypothetical protein n=1 Tax=Streptomyces sp. NPDC003717 TaxID=3154276 RepID=UPI0033BCF2D4